MGTCHNIRHMTTKAHVKLINEQVKACMEIEDLPENYTFEVLEPSLLHENHILAEAYAKADPTKLFQLNQVETCFRFYEERTEKMIGSVETLATIDD